MEPAGCPVVEQEVVRSVSKRMEMVQLRFLLEEKFQQTVGGFPIVQSMGGAEVPEARFVSPENPSIILEVFRQKEASLPPHPVPTPAVSEVAAGWHLIIRMVLLLVVWMWVVGSMPDRSGKTLLPLSHLRILQP